jgi:hypothetical protein
VRYIPRNELKLPDGWKEKANRALEKLSNATPEERKALLDRKSASDIWKALKEELASCSHEKCWYCESKIPHVSYGAVDHFRPKNAVYECPAHPGYWWLAFDDQNYRYSCELCNSEYNDPVTGTKGGKQTHFPLYDETKRVFDENCVTGVLCEEPMLLDPVVVADTTLMTFDEDGKAQPSRNEIVFPKEFERAKKSIEIYHLNRSRLVNQRQFDVCNKVKQLVAEGDQYLLLIRVENSTAARVSYAKIVADLYTMINSDEQEYSSAAKAVLYLYTADPDPATDREWVRELLRAA